MTRRLVQFQLPRFVFLGFLLISIDGFSYEKPRSRREVWKVIRGHNDRVNPATETPNNPEYYTWLVTGTIGDVVVHEGSVPVYFYDDKIDSIQDVATVPIDTPIKMDRYIRVRGTLYYLIDDTAVTMREGQTLDRVKEMLFVEGVFIRRDNENSFRMPKTLRVKDVEALVSKEPLPVAPGSPQEKKLKGPQKPNKKASKSGAKTESRK